MATTFYFINLLFFFISSMPSFEAAASSDLKCELSMTLLVDPVFKKTVSKMEFERPTVITLNLPLTGVLSNSKEELYKFYDITRKHLNTKNLITYLGWNLGDTSDSNSTGNLNSNEAQSYLENNLSQHMRRLEYIAHYAVNQYLHSDEHDKVNCLLHFTPVENFALPIGESITVAVGIPWASSGPIKYSPISTQLVIGSIVIPDSNDISPGQEREQLQTRSPIIKDSVIGEAATKSSDIAKVLKPLFKSYFQFDQPISGTCYITFSLFKGDKVKTFNFKN